MSTTSGGESEMQKAQEAKPQQEEESIFATIIARQIPATILFEDDRVGQLLTLTRGDLIKAS